MNDGILTLDPETEKPPVESRIADASAAREEVSKLKQADRIRSQRRAKTQGMIDGNPPWNPATLRAKGRGHQTNLNLREGEGIIDAAKTPYYDLVFQVPMFAQLKIDYGNNPEQKTEWSAIASEEYHNVLDDWRGMDHAFQLSQWQMCTFGIGPLVWEDSRDWRSEARKIGQVLVPDGTKANIDTVTTVAFPRSYEPGELYRLIKNEAAAKTAKWNVPAVKKAIIDASPVDLQSNYGNSWEYYQAELRRGDIGWNNKSKRIFVVDLFQKEFSGKISHFILLDEGMSTGVDSNKVGEPDDPLYGFLYRNLERFDEMKQILSPFFFDIGTGEWHSIKGLGPKIFDFCEVSNRLTCGMIDGASVGSGVTLEAADANALQQTQLVHYGGGVVIQPGYKAVQTRIADNLQGPLAVKHDLQNTLQSNTGQYRQRVSNENHEPTLGQAQMNVQQQAVLGNGAYNRYYKSLDSWHRETLRRLLNPKLTKSDPGGEEAFEFRQYCIDRGVPKEALKIEYFCSIKATRSVGNGSAQMRQMISKEIITMLPTMSEQARNSALRMWAASLGGQPLADILYPAFNEADIPNDHVWAASIENTALRSADGTVPPVTPKQDDVIHFSVHMADTQKHVGEVQAGQSNSIALLIHMENGGPHMAQHLAGLAGDPTRKEQFTQMREAWLTLSKLADQLKQQIMEAQAAAQKNPPAPQVDPKLASALMKVKLEANIKQQKVMAEIALKAEKQKGMQQLKDLETAHRIRLTNMESAAMAPAA